VSVAGEASSILRADAKDELDRRGSSIVEQSLEDPRVLGGERILGAQR
jgi:hypothetical protein